MLWMSILDKNKYENTQKNA